MVCHRLVSSRPLSIESATWDFRRRDCVKLDERLLVAEEKDRFIKEPREVFGEMASRAGALIFLALLSVQVSSFWPARINVPSALRLNGIQSRVLSPESGVTCETVVKQLLRQGVSSEGNFDVLAAARELDLTTKQNSKTELPPLLGVPLWCSGVDSGIRSRLVSAGALLFGAGGIDDGRKNPRDVTMKMSSQRFSESDVAVDAIVKGQVAGAVLPVLEENLAPFAESIYWTGLVAVKAFHADLGTYVICTTSLSDALSLSDIISSGRFPQAGILECSPANLQLPLEGTTVALTSQVVSDPDAPLEESTKQSINCFVDVLKKMGAEVLKAKEEVSSIVQGEEKYHVLLSPATATAALPIASQTSSSRPPPNYSPDPRPGYALPQAAMTLTMPIGLVAGDDDGYDTSMNEERAREGLPINCLLTACSGHTEKLVKLALAYEKYSRWSSEVFSPSQTRQTAQDDMDDAREAFGIYFSSSLLRYLAKKRN